jgi:hypothetical protein
MWNKGCKIHATVPKELLHLFEGKVAEGDVYRIFNFYVVPANGRYRTTPHSYKLMFQVNTVVEKSENALVTPHLLSFSRSLEIRRCQLEHDFLVGLNIDFKLYSHILVIYFVLFYVYFRFTTV